MTLKRRVKDNLTVWGDDRVAVYQMTIPELRKYRPDLFA